MKREKALCLDFNLTSSTFDSLWKELLLNFLLSQDLAVLKQILDSEQESQSTLHNFIIKY